MTDKINKMGAGALAEVSAVLEIVGDESVEKFVAAIIAAKRIALHGLDARACKCAASPCAFFT